MSQIFATRIAFSLKLPSCLRIGKLAKEVGVLMTSGFAKWMNAYDIPHEDVCAWYRFKKYTYYMIVNQMKAGRYILIALSKQTVKVQAIMHHKLCITKIGTLSIETKSKYVFAEINLNLDH